MTKKTLKNYCQKQNVLPQPQHEIIFIFKPNQFDSFFFSHFTRKQKKEKQIIKRMLNKKKKDQLLSTSKLYIYFFSLFFIQTKFFKCRISYFNKLFYRIKFFQFSSCNKIFSEFIERHLHKLLVESSCQLIGLFGIKRMFAGCSLAQLSGPNKYHMYHQHFQLVARCCVYFCIWYLEVKKQLKSVPAMVRPDTVVIISRNCLLRKSRGKMQCPKEEAPTVGYYNCISIHTDYEQQRRASEACSRRLLRSRDKRAQSKSNVNSLSLFQLNISV